MIYKTTTWLYVNITKLHTRETLKAIQVCRQSSDELVASGYNMATAAQYLYIDSQKYNLYSF